MFHHDHKRTIVKVFVHRLKGLKRETNATKKCLSVQSNMSLINNIEDNTIFINGDYNSLECLVEQPQREIDCGASKHDEKVAPLHYLNNYVCLLIIRR